MKKLEERLCTKCNQIKPIDEFIKDKHDKTGYTYRCAKCRSEYYKEYYKKYPEKAKIKNDKQKENRKKYYSSEQGIKSSRRNHLKRTYGISLEQYEDMLKNQNGKCAICDDIKTHDKHGVLAVDHCHKTGTIRGLLCFKCNTILGSVNDDVKILINAIKYLKKYDK